VTGYRTFDLNTTASRTRPDPDLLADMQQQPGGRQAMRSCSLGEAYLETWQRAFSHG